MRGKGCSTGKPTPHAATVSASKEEWAESTATSRVLFRLNRELLPTCSRVHHDLWGRQHQMRHGNHQSQVPTRERSCAHWCQWHSESVHIIAQHGVLPRGGCTWGILWRKCFETGSQTHLQGLPESLESFHSWALCAMSVLCVGGAFVRGLVQ